MRLVGIAGEEAHLRKAVRQAGKLSMRQVRMSTAQVLLASCIKATLCF